MEMCPPRLQSVSTNRAHPSIDPMSDPATRPRSPRLNLNNPPVTAGHTRNSSLARYKHTVQPRWGSEQEHELTPRSSVVADCILIPVHGQAGAHGAARTQRAGTVSAGTSQSEKVYRAFLPYFLQIKLT